MAYDAILAGARGLFFFGGQFKQVMNDGDRKLGWNWTYWSHVQRPLLQELTDPQNLEALTAPASVHPVKASAPDIAVSARETNGVLYLIAARRSPSVSGNVRFTGLPIAITRGTVLAHPGNNPARNVTVAAGTFTDSSPFAPHNARIYRLPLKS